MATPKKKARVLGAKTAPKALTDLIERGPSKFYTDRLAGPTPGEQFMTGVEQVAQSAASVTPPAVADAVLNVAHATSPQPNARAAVEAQVDQQMADKNTVLGGATQQPGSPPPDPTIASQLDPSVLAALTSGTKQQQFTRTHSPTAAKTIKQIEEENLPALKQAAHAVAEAQVGQIREESEMVRRSMDEQELERLKFEAVNDRDLRERGERLADYDEELENARDKMHELLRLQQNPMAAGTRNMTDGQKVLYMLAHTMSGATGSASAFEKAIEMQLGADARALKGYSTLSNDLGEQRKEFASSSRLDMLDRHKAYGEKLAESTAILENRIAYAPAAEKVKLKKIWHDLETKSMANRKVVADMQAKTDKRTSTTIKNSGLSAKAALTAMDKLLNSGKLRPDQNKAMTEHRKITAGTLSKIQALRNLITENDKNLQWGAIYDNKSSSIAANMELLGLQISRASGLVGNPTKEERALMNRVAGGGGSIRSWFSDTDDYMESLGIIEGLLSKAAAAEAEGIQANPEENREYFQNIANASKANKFKKSSE